jgi:DNA-binding NarL/FixJ family response regulator
MSQINSKRKVYLVEDHPITRDGFAQLINYQDDLLVCGQAGSIAAALEEIEEARPDLVVVDVSLADGNGIELVKQLHCKFPRLYLLVLSMHDESLYAERALQAGARGYVMKQESTDLVMAAIRPILQGEIYPSPKVQRNLDALKTPPMLVAAFLFDEHPIETVGVGGGGIVNHHEFAGGEEFGCAGNAEPAVRSQVDRVFHRVTQTWHSRER